MMPALYPITSRESTGLSQAAMVEQLMAGGATLIQLREKTASAREFYKEAKAAVAVAHAHGAKIIINDRVDIALATGADGVHLGQDDLPPLYARRLLGDAAIIGFSTHSPEQAQAAAHLPIDYLAIGPIFSTSSKTQPDPVVGLETIKLVRSLWPKPLVAIGGITLERAAAVWAAGADSVAVISDLFTHDNIALRTKDFFTLSR